MSGSAGRSPSAAPPPPAAGDLIDGKYRMERFLGEGAMGTVVAAHHMLLDVPVAVKLLSPTLMRHPEIVERFLREARAAARLKSEHVTRVMDVGTMPGGQPYIVMELLDGQDLERVLEHGDTIAVSQAVDWTMQALEAVAHAHAVGIVHRDLKPANLFLVTAPDGRQIVKVLDFGIAKLSDSPTDTGTGTAPSGKRVGSLTGEHAPLGSPAYMAPEQVRSAREIDVRADIWAMGAVLYEMLTGKLAFDGRGVGEIFAAVLHEDPKPIRARRPDVPEELEQKVLRCLRREREQRFQDVAEMAAAIASFGSGAFDEYVERIVHTLQRSGRVTNPASTSNPFGLEPVSERRPRVFLSRPTPGAFVPAERQSRASAETILSAERAQAISQQRSRKALWIGVIGAIVGIAGAGTFAAHRTRSAQTSASAPGPTATAAAQAPPPVSSSPSAASSTSAADTPPAPSASSVASAAAAPRKPARGRASKPASTSKPGPGGLPTVLDSPE